jgi:transglutaminase-like putative cysteine protease
MDYLYDSPVRSLTQYLRLCPRDTARQKVLMWKLETPVQAMRTQDGHGNVVHVLTLDKPVSGLAILASGSVQTSPTPDEPSDFTGSPLSPLLFLRPTGLTRAEENVAALAEPFRRAAGKHSALRELADAVHARGETPQDATHRFIACCRHLHVPARYVSGYLYSPGAPGAQAALHSWAEAWVGERWRSFDVVRNSPIGEAHIKIAIGADYLDVCPIRGVRTGGGVETLVAQAHVQVSNQ